MRSFVLLLLLFVPPLASAADRDPAGYEQVLLPIIADRPGAYGSHWRSELTIRNVGETPVQLFQTECVFFCDCPGFVGACTFGSPTLPHRHAELGLRPDQQHPDNLGRFVYVGKTDNPPVAWQLRVRDISREALNFGTEVPVIHEEEFLRGKTNLLDVPLDVRFRQHLRVYGISSPSGEAVVRVRLYGAQDNALLAEQLLILQPPAEDVRIPLPGERPPLPAYAELRLLTSKLRMPVPDRIRVEIQPETTGLRYWTFVAVTNNETQHVTLITPQ